MELCPTPGVETVSLLDAIIRNDGYNLTWYLDSDRNNVVPDPTAVGLGMYYLSFARNDLHCMDNIMEVEVMLP